MSNKNFKYYQPNKMDFKDTCGDCAVRAYSKTENIDWLTAYDILYKYSREVWDVVNSKKGFEYTLENTGYTYNKISNKKGSKRPTVESFTKEHKEGIYICVVANHYVSVIDGIYYDTWDSGSKALYGFWNK